MELRVHPIKISAGRPIAFLNSKTAKRLGAHTSDRIVISKNKSSVIAIVDVVGSLVDKGEIAFSEELISILGDVQGLVDVKLAQVAASSAILQNRVECMPYSEKELDSVMQDIVDNKLSDAEIAYFISGVNHCGMSETEIIYLTKAIVKTGKRIRWPHKIVADKHSIGGIPANRTTPIVVSICAAAGLVMPKTSSRAITSAAGTADTIESIAPVSLSIDKLKKIVKKTRACLSWGGALSLASADDKLIRVEKMLRIDPEPQLLASILAKKVAVGSTHVLIDIPYGHGAKVSLSRAQKLKHLFESLGKKLGLKVLVVITDGRQPIGNGVGPVLEMHDVIRVLKQDNSPKDLEQKSIFLAGRILELTSKCTKGKGESKAREILHSGAAYEKFCEIITAQGGDPRKWLPEAPYHHTTLSRHSGIIKRIENQSINYIARIAGSPADKASGLYLYKHVGDKVQKEDKIITIYAESKVKLRQALKFFKKQKPITII